MTVNLNKIKLYIFNDKYCINDKSGPILFNRKPIEICKEYHYLGITFSTSKNRFKTHFTQKRDKALNAKFAARKKRAGSCGFTTKPVLTTKNFRYSNSTDIQLWLGNLVYRKTSWRIWDFASLLYQAISWRQNIDSNISRVWRNWAISPYTAA